MVERQRPQGVVLESVDERRLQHVGRLAVPAELREPHAQLQAGEVKLPDEATRVRGESAPSVSLGDGHDGARRQARGPARDDLGGQRPGAVGRPRALRGDHQPFEQSGAVGLGRLHAPW